MIKVKLSTNYWAVRKRIQRLPLEINDTIDAFLKKDAISMIKTFQDGIRFKKIKLEPLASVTIINKSDKQQSLPAHPLYGEGFDEKKSFINMLIFRKLKKGYRVSVRSGKHHSGLSYKTIWAIHEFGVTIQRGKSTIRIPPRPIFNLSWQQLLKKLSRRDPASEVKKAITEYINTGKNKLKDRIKADNAKINK